MRFYNGQHTYYCGVDLHAKSMYSCIYSQDGQKLYHRKMRNDALQFAQIASRFKGMVVATESTYNWYWLADVCSSLEVPFVLGHALYMRAVHGGKVKNDRVDSEKIALMLRAGMLPTGYAYPAEQRATRDLLRRRTYAVRQRAALLGHIQLLNDQYNLPGIGRGAKVKRNREGLLEHFPLREVRGSVEADLSLIERYDQVIKELEKRLYAAARVYDEEALALLQSIRGVGKIISMTVLYETHDISRFARVQDYLSYSRLVRGTRSSAGKKVGEGSKRMGNPYLKWAFSEAVTLMLRDNPEIARYYQKLVRRRGKAGARGMLAAKVGRAVYFMLKRRVPFDEDKFLKK